MKRHVEKLKALDACKEAVDWAATEPNGKVAWANCKRGERMAWYVGKMVGLPDSRSRQRLVACVLECARLNERNNRNAQECNRTTAAYLRGDATLDDVRQAITACAAYTKTNTARIAPANAAICATYVATVAKAAYLDIAFVADLTVRYAAAGSHFRLLDDTTLARCADIVRKHYPTPPRKSRR